MACCKCMSERGDCGDRTRPDHGAGDAAVAASARRRSLPLNPIPNRAPPSSNRRRRRTALVIVAATKGRAAAAVAEVVREFYDGVNRRDLAAVGPLIAEGCVYEDLVFPRPMVGRAQVVVAFFAEFMGSISPDLLFVIDDISGEDPSAIGVTWHLEWKGRPFPFSRGCSFYRCSPDPQQQQQQTQIVYGRDCVEPATKPGELALVVIRGVTWILERFQSLARML